MKQEGKVKSKAVNTILGITKMGRKELLGMYIAEREGANFWLSVLTDLQNRGVSDMLIVCIDNLKDFSEAVAAIYLGANIQTCEVHQIRNSLKYVASKNQNEFMADLKRVYQADTKEMAEQLLDELEKRWGAKYPVVISSWRNSWHKLYCYFKNAKDVRKLIYTTNTIEGFHCQVRKITKTAFTSEMALMKLIYLAHRNIRKSGLSLYKTGDLRYPNDPLLLEID